MTPWTLEKSNIGYYITNKTMWTFISGQVEGYIYISEFREERGTLCPANWIMA